MATTCSIPIFARGEIIEGADVVNKGRYGASFATPDAGRHLDKLILHNRNLLTELYALSTDEIIDFLVELGDRLNPKANPHVQWALGLNETFSDMPRALCEGSYRGLTAKNGMLSRERLEAVVATIGREHIDGWDEQTQYNGRRIGVRAIGVPTVHVIAGNAPGISTITFLRNALIRGYALVKIPSNELGAAIALGKTLLDMAPDHPLTRSWSAAYWRGGDTAFEEKLYHPRNFDRIVAWGGRKSITHIARYLRPGLDIVMFDPKNSRAFIGEEALQSEAAMDEAAIRLAADVGYNNQNGCANARLAFIRCAPGVEAADAVRRFARKVFDAIQRLPAIISTPAPRLSADFAARLDGLRMLDDEFEVVGGDERGGVIISLQGEPVDFANDLAYRTLNLIPVADFDVALRRTTRDVQTVGVWPACLRDELRLPLALHGVQRVTTLGYMLNYDSITVPHDGTEALRRMATWVVSEDCEAVPELWHDLRERPVPRHPVRASANFEP